MSCWLHRVHMHALLTYWGYVRDDSRFAPSQWETALLCKHLSHWLGASLELALYVINASHPLVIAFLKHLKRYQGKQVSQAGISNCIPQRTVGCNYLSLSEIPSFILNQSPHIISGARERWVAITLAVWHPINTLKPDQIYFEIHFIERNVGTMIKKSLNLVTEAWTGNMSTLVEVMTRSYFTEAWTKYLILRGALVIFCEHTLSC